MTHHAHVRLECADPGAAAAVAAALGPELEDLPAGATAAARADGQALCLEVEATDLAALRAALAGLVRVADAAIRAAQGEA